MRLDLAQRALRDRRGSLLAWCLGLVAYMVMIVAVWPSVRDSAELVRAIEDYPEALKEFFGGAESFDYATATGYLNTQLFSLMVPLFLAIFAIGFGASTLAGEEEQGVLDLVLAAPIRRRRIVLEKAVAVVGGTVLLAATIAVGILVPGALVDLDVSIACLLTALLGAVLLGLLSGLLALLVGTASGSRGVAIGVAAGGFAAAYLLQVLAGIVSWLEPARLVSPFYLANGTVPIEHGIPVADYLVLAALCALLVATTVAVFGRRDVAG